MNFKSSFAYIIILVFSTLTICHCLVVDVDADEKRAIDAVKGKNLRIHKLQATIYQFFACPKRYFGLF